MSSQFRDPAVQRRGAPWWLVAFVLFDVVIFAAIGAYLLLGGSGRDGDAIIVYCAHDAVYSQEIIDRFTEETGHRVIVVHDSEATKSLGLIEMIKREKDHPRADVFWNNEELGMRELASLGLLDTTQPTVTFGARMRVIIYNTQAFPGPRDEVAAAIAERLASGDLSRFAIAKPIYGTTLTHYAILWATMGGTALQAQHADWLSRGMKVVDGNGKVKDLVAAGTLDFGWTDTDDYFQAVDAGAPVGYLPVSDPGVIVIPNTASLIARPDRSPAQRAAAEDLLDYLISDAVAVRLAQTARQIPLHTVDADGIPDAVRELATDATDAAKLPDDILAARAACLEWLRSEYGQ